jgi:hypothetical protein
MRNVMKLTINHVFALNSVFWKCLPKFKLTFMTKGATMHFFHIDLRGSLQD